MAARAEERAEAATVVVTGESAAKAGAAGAAADEAGSRVVFAVAAGPRVEERAQEACAAVVELDWEAGAATLRGRAGVM